MAPDSACSKVPTALLVSLCHRRPRIRAPSLMPNQRRRRCENLWREFVGVQAEQSVGPGHNAANLSEKAMIFADALAPDAVAPDFHVEYVIGVRSM